MDLGIQRVLSGQREGLTGEQLETAVVAEAFKTLRTAGVEADLMHLRTHDGREIDLLIRGPRGSYVALEVKSSRRPAPVHARHLRGLEPFLDGPLSAALVVHGGHGVTSLPGGVFALPPAVLFGPAPLPSENMAEGVGFEPTEA